MPQARFYTTEQVSNNQYFTPEGFLVCIGVVLARTGEQLYNEGEIPMDAGPDGMIRVDRPPEEVFRPETIASFNGKALVIDHPEESGEIVDVVPQNWNKFMVGAILYPRQGEGVLNDVMVGDLIWYDPQAIELVRSKQMVQISMGYDAEYEELGNGKARQSNIIGNHGALVKAGRCGPLCSIRDHACSATNIAIPKKGANMPTVMSKTQLRDYLRKAYHARDKDELEKLEEEAGKKMGDAVGTETAGGDTGEPGSTPSGESLHIHLHQPGGEASAGAGGSTTGDEFGGGAPGGAGEDNPRLAAVEKTIGDIKGTLDQVCQHLGLGSGNPAGGTDNAGEMPGGPMMSDPMQDSEMDIQHAADNGPEEEFASMPNKEIKGGFGNEAPPGAYGALNQGSHDRHVGRGRDSLNIRARDSRHLAEHWQDTLAIAEILSPGVRLPTFDRAAKAITTIDAMCRFRRRVLNTVYDTDMEMHNTLDNLVDNPRGYSPTSAMTCDSVSNLFRAAGQVKRERNNATMGRDQHGGNNGFRSANGHSEANGIAALNATLRAETERVWGNGKGGQGQG